MTFNNAKIFLGLPTCLLKYCGLWIVSEKYESLNNIYRFFGFLLHYSVLLSILIYLGVVWGNIEAMSNALYVLFTETSTCFKITVFVVNKKFISNLLEFMNSDIFLPMTRRQEDILMEQARKARYLTIFLVATANINVAEWCIIPLLNQGDVKTFPYTMWMPPDTQKSPGYQLGYIYQSLFGIMCANMFMGIDGFIISAITFACAQLDIIKDKVQKIRSVPSGQRINITEEERCSINNNLFDECISQHQSIIQYVKLVEGLFHLSIFLQLSGSVIIVCMLGFRLSVEPPNTFEFYSSLNYMLNMLAQLFFYCWSGNELTKRSSLSSGLAHCRGFDFSYNETFVFMSMVVCNGLTIFCLIYSEDVRNELYLCQWHEQDMKLKKKLCFAMECLKKPILFKAGHYITLSRPTFVRILRCSYSYFAVLNQVNKK